MALNFGSEWLESMPPLETTLSFQENWENKASLTKHHDTYSFIDPYRFKKSMSGKVVLITQAHRGIGRSTAIAFARKAIPLCSRWHSASSLLPKTYFRSVLSAHIIGSSRFPEEY